MGQKGKCKTTKKNKTTLAANICITGFFSGGKLGGGGTELSDLGGGGGVRNEVKKSFYFVQQTLKSSANTELPVL